MGIYQGSKLMSGGGGGPSPYEIAKQNGYPGTEQEFNRLLAALDQNTTKEETNTLLQEKADKNSVVNPNLLDNWYFANPVNQRGNTEYTGSGYTIDRFIQKVDSGVVQVTSNGIVLSGSDCLLHQIIEFSQDLIGETVTFSVLTANNHLYACTGTVTDSANTNFAVKFLDSSNSNIAIISDSSKRVIVQIRAMGGATYTVKAAKLELGSQQTLAHQDADGNWVLNEIPDYGEQLRRCQLYYQRYDNPQRFLIGVGNVVNQCWFPFTLSTMRKIPSVKHANIRIYDIQANTQTLITDNTIVSEYYKDGYFVLSVSHSSITVGKIYMLNCDSDDGYIELIADL